jgi:hypothetical protein
LETGQGQDYQATEETTPGTTTETKDAQAKTESVSGDFETEDGGNDDLDLLQSILVQQGICPGRNDTGNPNEALQMMRPAVHWNSNERSDI